MSEHQKSSRWLQAIIAAVAAIIGAFGGHQVAEHQHAKAAALHAQPFVAPAPLPTEPAEGEGEGE